jgi:hypothetical protein
VNTTENRSTEQLKLRLAPAEAEAVRAAAKAADRTLSDYVLDLHHRRVSRAPVELREFDALAEIGRKLSAVPDEVRKLDADLGRLSGRLASFFTSDPGRALAHQDELNDALRAVRDLRAQVLPVLADLQVTIAEPRDQVAAVLGTIARRRRREDQGA